jgi:glycosyltransferase involved in cell wall biosynthesis
VIPAWLRPLARGARTAGAHARGLQARLAGPAPRGHVAIWYGQPIPSRDQIEVGGILKLQHLAALYPNEPRAFNLLYLVSSRLPDGAEALAYWARKKGARLVVNQNGVAYPAWYGPGWASGNASMCELLAHADHVFYQSEFCRISADRFAVPARGAHEVLYNAVDTNAFSPATTLPGGPLTLLLGGSQDQWYRFDAAVRALRFVLEAGVKARLLITGRLRWHPDADRTRDDANGLVDELKLREHVEFIGPYSQSQAPAIFKRAQILVHTKYNDPCPAVVLEALATGLPVVYSASGGVPELVGADAGVGIPAELTWERDVPPDPAAVARGVIEVSRELTARSRAARARAVERFDIAPWLARHRVVFEKLVAA